MPKYLGKSKRKYVGLEALQVNCSKVILKSAEVTALCPITGQPDFYNVSIMISGGYSIESKSLKLFFHSLRGMGIFCEDLSGFIKNEVEKCFLKITKKNNIPLVSVVVIQIPRGGIEITSEAK